MLTSVRMANTAVMFIAQDVFSCLSVMCIKTKYLTGQLSESK